MAMSKEERLARQREANRRWRENNPEAYKKSYKKQNRLQYEKDQAEGFERQRKYREEHKDEIKARMKCWAADNRPRLNSYARNQYFLQKYGITRDQRDKILTLQGNRCACCSGEKPGNRMGWVVDHDHVTGKVRAILCHNCNLALGLVKDDTEHLKQLISYLEVHRARD